MWADEQVQQQLSAVGQNPTSPWKKDKNQPQKSKMEYLSRKSQSTSFYIVPNLIHLKYQPFKKVKTTK